MFPFSNLRYSTLGLARRAVLLVRRRELAVSGKCEMCGKCCTSLNFTLGAGWISSKRAFERLKKKYPEYERFEICGRAPGGAITFRCRMLGDDNLCSDHENRPAFCREYPTRDVYFMGGELLSNCGFRFEAVPSFKNMLREKIGVSSMEIPSEKRDQSSNIADNVELTSEQKDAENK